MKKDNKFEIHVIIIIIVFSLILLGLYYLYSTYAKRNTYILYLNKNTVLRCLSRKCTDVSSNIDEYNNKAFDTYIDGAYKGKNIIYYNSFNDKVYVFDNDNNSIYKDNTLSLLGISGTVNVSPIPYEKEEITASELSDIKEVSNINFDINSSLSKIKVSLDFDGDSIFETLYFVNNINLEEENYFSLILYKDDKYRVIRKEESNNKFELYSYNIENIINVYDDNKIELILSKTDMNDNSCLSLYRLIGKKFKTRSNC